MSIHLYRRLPILTASDHGYTLGGFRVNSHKMQVYDHVTRVPFLVRGPGVASGTEVSVPAAMVDVAPTLLQLAGATNVDPESMDGISFADHIMGKATPNSWPRDGVLIEYQSLTGGPKNEFSAAVAPSACRPGNCFGRTWDEAVARVGSDCVSAYGYKETSRRPMVTMNKTMAMMRMTDSTLLPPLPSSKSDGPNNTYSALRFTRGSAYGEVLYAEFADVSDPLAWDFAPDRINFYELYNMSSDPFMLRNIYHTAPAALKADLHARLHRAIACKGAKACTASLSETGEGT